MTPPRDHRTATPLDRLLLAMPLLGVFGLLASLYAWQALRHETPWLFADELEFTQLARAIADTGHPARRGEPLGRIELYSYLTAPAWWMGSVRDAYDLAKYIGVATMTATLFPAFLLARMVVSRPAALLAATAAAAIPALAFTGFLIEEPLAYFWSTLTLWLIARALVARRPAALALAAGACLVAPLVRSQLAVLAAVYVLSAAWLVWTSGWARSRRSAWTGWDRAGAAVFLVGSVIVLNQLLSNRSAEWQLATRLYKDRMLEYGLWAAGALAIGLGVLPLVAGIAAIWPRRARPEPERVFVALTAASLGAFGFYTAVKAAYVSATFATRVNERNLIYVAPLLFAATALVLERRPVRLPALAATAAFVWYLLISTPYQMQYHFYSDAPGLAILSGANRELAWTPEHAQTVLVWLLAGAVAVLLAPLALRARPRALAAVAVAAGLATVGWNLTGEIAAASAANSFSRDFMRNLPQPPDWLDRATGGEPALYLGQQIADPNGVQLLEFWNRSLERVWSIDGSAPGPGPTLTPDVTTRYGTLSDDPGFRYAVADVGVNLVGTVVARKGGWKLYRLDPPLRLASAETGLFSDGWLGQQKAAESVKATYSRFSTPGERAGTVVVNVSRKGWCGKDKPGRVDIRVGELAIGADRHPTIGRLTREVGWVVHSCAERAFPLPTPPPPFQVEVTIAPPFVPAELDPGQTDTRNLGAQVSFDFRPAP